MTTSSAIMIPEASALTIDTSCIDCSEVESQEDKDFLLEKGESILRIVAKAALDVGEHLVAIQDRFKAENGTGAGLKAYYKSLGLTRHQADHWSNKYRLWISTQELGEETDPARIESLADRAGTLIQNLPSLHRECFIRAISAGEIPTESDVLEVSRDKEVKLTKAEELVAKYGAKKEKLDEEWEQAKADPELKSDSAEYKKANSAKKNNDALLAKFKQQVADLQAQIEEEKLRTAEQTEESARLEKELQKLKFDDAKIRAERVKKLSSTLTVSIPQVTADVLKFFAEIDEYPEEVKKHVYENARALADQIADRL